ncbi:MAG: hypothetical protein IJ466_08535 [Clostridia bacterium]|nr:hypothetical protein [Clostridia bacterium]
MELMTGFEPVTSSLATRRYIDKVFAASGTKAQAISPNEGIILSAVSANDDSGRIGAGAAGHILQSRIVDFLGRILCIPVEFIVLVRGLSSLFVF